MEKKFLAVLLVYVYLFSLLISAFPVKGQQLENIISVPKKSLEMFIVAVKSNPRWVSKWYYDPDNVVYQIPTLGGPQPNRDYTAYAALMYVFSLEHSDMLELTSKSVIELRNRTKQIITKWFSQGSVSNLWDSTRLPGAVDIPFSSMVIWLLSEANILGLTDETSLRRAVSDLKTHQHPSGGWYASNIGGAYTEPKAAYTALVLIALLKAKVSGIEVPETTIVKAVKFLESKAKASGKYFYWDKEGLPTPTYFVSSLSSREEFTALILYSLSMAKIQGFNVDEAKLKGAAQYLIERVSTIPSDKQFEIAWGLAVAAGAGTLKISDLEEITMPLLDSYAMIFNPYTFGTAYETIPRLSIYFLDWMETVIVENPLLFSISPDKAGYPEQGKIVRGAMLQLTQYIRNKGPSTLKVEFETDIPPLPITSISEKKVTVNPGSEGTFTFSVNIPANYKTGDVTIGVNVYRVVNGYRIPSRWSRSITVTVIKNSKVELTKKVSKDKLFLGDNLSVNLTLKNTGDVPASDIIVFENLTTSYRRKTIFNADQGLFIPPGFTVPTLNPGEQIAISYVAEAYNCSPGETTFSSTTLTYVDVFEKGHQIKETSKIKVERPLVILTGEISIGESNSSSEVEIPWRSKLTMTLSLENKGNTPAHNVNLKVTVPDQLEINPEETQGTISRGIVTWKGELNVSGQVKVKIVLETSMYYKSLKVRVPIIVDLGYTDPRGVKLESYRETQKYFIIIIMPLWLKVTLITAVIAVVLALSFVLYRKAKKVEEKKPVTYKYLTSRKKRHERLG